jgi:hypothetical protein
MTNLYDARVVVKDVPKRPRTQHVIVAETTLERAVDSITKYYHGQSVTIMSIHQVNYGPDTLILR